MMTIRHSITVAALLLSMLLAALDLTIISTAVPRITHDFHSLNDVGWYGSAFFLTMCVFQTIWGMLYKYCSIKYVFLSAILIFELGTLACAVSTNSAGFIVGRAVSGCGGAGIVAGTYIILAYIIPPDRIPVFYGLNGIVFTIASVSGPLIGGAFTSSDLTWRWCFYINIPLGGMTALIIFFFARLPPNAPPEQISPLKLLTKLDIPGCLLISGSLICYLLAMEWGGITKPWNSPQIIGLLVGWILLLGAFALVEWLQGDDAMIPSQYLRSRGIRVCCAFVFCLNAANYIRVYYLPIYFQSIDNASPVRSGILLLAYIVPTSVFTLLSGALLSKMGYYQFFLILGAGLVTIGSALLWTLDIGSPSAKEIGYQILAGTGDGICIQVPVTAVQAFTDESNIAPVTALVLFFQLGSGVIGVSAGQSIFTNRMLASLPRYASGIAPSRVLEAGAAKLDDYFGEEAAQGVLRAYMVGIKGAWILTLALCGVAFLIALGAPRVSISGKMGVSKNDGKAESKGNLNEKDGTP